MTDLTSKSDGRRLDRTSRGPSRDLPRTYGLGSYRSLPNRIEAYLLARDIDAPREAIERWHKIADC